MEVVSAILAFLVILTVLVFVHEMGHFLVARRNGVRVEVFSIGFGKEIFGWTDKYKTRWKFSMVPLGGYVKMFGDANAASQPSADFSELSAEEQAVAFQTKRLGQRFWIVAAGPLANFLFAWVILVGLFVTVGQQFTPPEVGAVMPGSAAEVAGMLPGDRILELNGVAIERFEDVQRIIRPNPEVRVEILVLRDGAPVALTATPELSELTNNFGMTQEIGLLGITRGGVEYVQHGFAVAIWRAGGEVWFLSRATLEALGQIIVGNRSAKELGGPIRIAQMSGAYADAGLVPTLGFMVMLSVTLGLINLFPIPMLDGGHLLFYIIEFARGRPLGERAQEYGFRIGIALVFSLMIFVTLNDLIQLEVFDFIMDLAT
ncbi:MAG: RIP metalloprotease RseP [Limibaculum sp.]